MGNKKIAIIDLGTNTFHILMAEITDNDFKVLDKEKTSVKIGQGGISQGYITEDALDRAMRAILDFKEKIVRENIHQVYATATSAIRNAKNGKELIDKIKEQTDISVKVISGDQEAEYIYFGVKKAVKLRDDTSLIMDIGGGSIEFIICNENHIFWKKSYEIGAQRLLDKFHYHDPIINEEITNLENYLNENLKSLLEAVNEYKPQALIGSSGTFDTLSEIYSLENNLPVNPEDTELPLPLVSFYDIHNEIIHKNREERMQIPGMIELRVDMIVVASCLIKFVLEKFNLKEMRVSTYALKEGLLYSIIDKLQENLKES